MIMKHKESTYVNVMASEFHVQRRECSECLLYMKQAQGPQKESTYVNVMASEFHVQRRERSEHLLYVKRAQGGGW